MQAHRRCLSVSLGDDVRRDSQIQEHNRFLRRRAVVRAWVPRGGGGAIKERSWSDTSRTSSTKRACTKKNTRNPTRKTLTEQQMKNGFTSLLLTQGAYHRDQYKVVQPYQGDSDTVQTEERPECKHILPWKRENVTRQSSVPDTEQWSSLSPWTRSPSSWSSWLGRVQGCSRNQENTNFTATQVQKIILGIFEKKTLCHPCCAGVLRAMTLAIFACGMRCNAPSDNEGEISRAGLSKKDRTEQRREAQHSQSNGEGERRRQV